MEKPIRGRDLGIPFPGKPGPFNAITDVTGVEVGHETIIQGEGPLIPGKGPVRTGVTAILPRGKQYDPVFAAWFSLNGCGELTGTTWLEESGFLESGIALTNTASVGTVHNAVITWATQNLTFVPGQIRDVFWYLPVVGETNDMLLNDIAGFHVQKENVEAAFNRAASGPIAEGSVGGGTGMVCYEFKGGIGTSSRQIDLPAGRFTLGVLVQANYGTREQLTIAGAPVGQEISDMMPELHGFLTSEPGSGSIIAVVATDAPLLPHQLKRLTKRVGMGIGRLGGVAGNSSGDLFLAFSTANPRMGSRGEIEEANFLRNNTLTPFFEATIQATEEAIVNALVAARTMTGINGNTVYGLPHDRLVEVLKKYNRYQPAPV